MPRHPLQLPLHGDDQLEARLRLPDVPPDLPEEVNAGAGVVQAEGGELPAAPEPVQGFALGAGDEEGGEEEEEERVHGLGEEERRTDGRSPPGENIYSGEKVELETFSLLETTNSTVSLLLVSGSRISTIPKIGTR